MTRLQAAVLFAVLLVPRLSGQCETGQVLGPTGDPGAQMGGSVALTGDTLVVGMPSADAYGAASGEVRVYRKTGANWVLTQSLGSLATLKAGDRFGTSVSAEGPYIAVGADGVDGLLNADEGAAYMFKADATGSYVLKNKLFAPFHPTASGQSFGCSVSTSAGWLIVGAKFSDLAATDAGAAFLYRESGTNWFLHNSLSNGSASPGDLLGASVSTKNGLFAVGIPQDDVGGHDTGSVRTYFVVDGVWVNPNTFDEIYAASPVQADAHFGSAVAISDHALAVAASHQDAGATDSGAVHLFRIDASTTFGQVSKDWLLDQTLVPASPQASGEFGSSIALDGSTLVVGSRSQDKLPATDTGALDVYRRAGPVWKHRKHLDPGQAAQADYAGTSVAVSGPVVAAGAPGDDVSGAVDAGSVTLWSMTDCPGLYASLTTTTQSLPQPVQFWLNAGPAYALSPYVLLGSFSGTSPGFNLHGAHVPLNLDAYSSFIFSIVGSPLFWGQLDGAGKAASTLPQPLYIPPIILGATFHHAFIAKAAPGVPWYASNAEPLAYVKIWSTEPSADAGPDWIGPESSFGGGNTVSFDGGGSQSPNGWIAQWYWDFGDGQFGVGEDVDHAYAKGGDYVATLTVVDKVGAAAQDTRSIHMNMMPLGIIDVLTVNPEQAQDIWFSSANSYDPDGTVEKYRWTFGAETVTTINTTISYKFNSPGLKEITLTAIDDDGLAGSNIAEVSVDVAPCETPNQPSHLSGTPTSTTTAFLTWQDHATNETAYQVLKNWIDISGDLPPNTTSFAVTGLAAGQTYEFRVRCKNACGDSPSSDKATVTTPCPPAAPAPFGCDANRITSTPQPDPILVEWQYNGPPVTAFRIARLNPGLDENNPDLWHNAGEVPGTQLSFIDDQNLENGKVYKYKVRNYIDAGPPCGKVFSGYSNISSAKP